MNNTIAPETKGTPIIGNITPIASTLIPAPDAVTTRTPDSAAKGDDNRMSQPVKPS